ncbi:TA system antitoxin ParD family protein [Burkholderia multivorans]|uniref:TA system antitoxin ParD family protein n=1 Tax=Burkholderia multivorans TaxID=87883 RepID=UPI00374F60EB
MNDHLRKTSALSCRSINAQATFRIRMGMLCETNPTLSFNEIVARELLALGVVAQPVAVDST